MGIKTQIVATCDKCKRIIQEGDIWIDYSYAGYALHWGCILVMSAVEFIEVVHRRGDQMFVRDSTSEDEPYAAELKHLDWTKDPRIIKNVLMDYRRSKSIS